MNRSETLVKFPAGVPTAARLFIKLLARIRVGHLQLVTPEGDRLLLGDTRHPPSAELVIRLARLRARPERG